MGRGKRPRSRGGGVVSEPTYRVELENDPTEIEPCRWHAKVYRVADGEQVYSAWGSTRDYAFDSAQTWARAAVQPPEAPSTVYLTEDGEIHDRFDLHSVKA